LRKEFTGCYLGYGTAFGRAVSTLFLDSMAIAKLAITINTALSGAAVGKRGCRRKKLPMLVSLRQKMVIGQEDFGLHH